MSTKEIPQSYDNEWKKFCDWLGIQKKRNASIPKPPPGERLRYMVLSDMHIPFHNNEAIVEAVEDGKRRKVDVVVVAGDIVDCYSLSRFSKFQTVPIKTEYMEARKILDYLSRSFNKTIVLSGNHEQRERKYFSSRLTADELDWLLNKPILHRCAQDIPNVEIYKNRVHGVDMNWILQVGNVIIGHPEKSSSVNLKPVEDFRKWIGMWGTALNLNPLPKLIVIGHTHQAGIVWSGETMLVEGGCLCQFQEYAMQPNLYPKPQRLAYTIFDMNGDKVDISSVHQFYPRVM